MTLPATRPVPQNLGIVQPYSDRCIFEIVETRPLDLGRVDQVADQRANQEAGRGREPNTRKEQRAETGADEAENGPGGHAPTFDVGLWLPERSGASWVDLRRLAGTFSAISPCRNR